MSESVPNYTVLGPVPSTARLVVLGANKWPVLTSWRMQFWMNRTFLANGERNRLELVLCDGFVQDYVVGSTKAGTDLYHPRWRTSGVEVLRGLTVTDCSGLVAAAQITASSVRAFCFIRWNAAAPAELRGKWISPIYAFDAIRTVTQAGRCSLAN